MRHSTETYCYYSFKNSLFTRLISIEVPIGISPKVAFPNSTRILSNDAFLHRNYFSDSFNISSKEFFRTFCKDSFRQSSRYFLRNSFQYSVVRLSRIPKENTSRLFSEISARIPLSFRREFVTGLFLFFVIA